MIPTNTAASIHQRILNKAASEHRPFNELLQYYAMERFLYRLGESPHCIHFVLKGALVFLAWRAPLTRPTRDMDFLGYTNNSVDHLVHIVQEVCAQPVEADGMAFDLASVQGEVIKEEADYQGVRVSFLGFLGKTQIHMRMDVGFVDVVTPSPYVLELPTIFDNMSKPCICAYPPETVIAEKLQTMVALGMINSRMKDFYDILFIAKSMEFDFHLLREAVLNTFNQRKTAIPKETPSAFTEEFASEKQVQWAGFLRKNRIEDTPKDMKEIVDLIKVFLNPVIYPPEIPPAHWSAEAGWKD